MTRLLNRDPIEPSRLSRWLRDLANQVEARDPSAPKGTSPLGSDQLREALREHLRARRARENLFGPDLFADPAWDLLLELLLSDLDRRTVSISSACLAAAVPSTTACAGYRFSKNAAWCAGSPTRRTGAAVISFWPPVRETRSSDGAASIC